MVVVLLNCALGAFFFAESVRIRWGLICLSGKSGVMRLQFSSHYFLWTISPRRSFCFHIVAAHCFTWNNAVYCIIWLA